MMLCQMDAMSCITDGRSNAEKFFEKLGNEDGSNKGKYNRIAESFLTCVKSIEQMWGLFGDTSN